MKIQVSARCIGMSEPAEEIYDVDDNTNEQDLEEIAREHGNLVTGYEYWYEIIK